jgi:hypothetical protein
MSAVDPPSPARSRVPLVIGLFVLLVAALLVGDAARSDDGDGRGQDAATQLPDARDADGVWFCPGAPPSGALGGARESVRLANAGAHATTAVVTLLADDGTSVAKRISLPAHDGRTIARTDIDAERTGMLVVQARSPAVVVEDQIVGAGHVSVEPCATNGSDSWYFAAGSTARGVEHWVVIANPFGEDAKVDVRLLRPDGQRVLQGVAVGRRSRVALPVHERVLRDRRVGVVVNARTGRVVVEQSVVFGEGSAATGLARSLGSPRPAVRWWFPASVRAVSGRTRIAIANPRGSESVVDVQVVVAGDEALTPVSVNVPGNGVATVQLGGCPNPPGPRCVPVPDDVAFDTYVNTGPDSPVVAEAVVTGAEDGLDGAASSLGLRRSAQRWYFATQRIPGQTGSFLSLVNPSAETVDVAVSFVRGGEEPVTPERLQRVSIPPSKPVFLTLTGTAIGARPSAVIVEATGGVFASRTIVRDDEMTIAPGIPAGPG